MARKYSTRDKLITLLDQDESDIVGYVQVDDTASANGSEEWYGAATDVENDSQARAVDSMAGLKALRTHVPLFTSRLRTFHILCPFTYDITALVGRIRPPSRNVNILNSLAFSLTDRTKLAPSTQSSVQCRQPIQSPQSLRLCNVAEQALCRV